jgi:outer membrane protein assembly factor BamB
LKSGKVSNNPGTRDQLTGSERVLCFDVETGKELWKKEYERNYAISYPRGPRCTPTVDSGKAYTLGAEGDLLCLDAASGKVLWSKLLTKEYNVKTPIWGFAAHPLVDGDLLYCVVGGKGSVAVAFDKNTGREVWRALTAREPGYCPPTMIEHAGIKQLLIWHPESLNSLNPKTGKLYWSVPLTPSFGMSITAPRQQGRYLFTCGIGNAAVLLELDNMKPAVKEVWRGKAKTAVIARTARRSSMRPASTVSTPAPVHLSERSWRTANGIGRRFKRPPRSSDRACHRVPGQARQAFLSVQRSRRPCAG